MLHHLLWTSGWDSTFRLLDLLVVKRHTVQPYYLLDATRHSIYAELRAMMQIREQVFKQYPHTEALLLKTKFFEVSGLVPNDQISNAYYQIKQKIHLGSQYEWLALFAEEHKIYLEFAAEKTPLHQEKKKPANWLDAYVTAHLEPIPQRDELIYRVRETSEMYPLFRYFEWPLVQMTKLDLDVIAKKNNFRNIMDLTWFCHFPINNKPCGKCAPCRQAIESGFAYRIRTMGKIRYHIYNLKQKIKQLLK
jgi:hypothetical protein